MSIFKSEIGKRFLSLWLKIDSEVKEFLLFAALGILSAVSFIFPNWFEFSGSFSKYYRFSGGMAFVVSFGIFFSKIFGYNDREKKSLCACGFVYWLFFFMGALYWLVYPLTLDLKTHGLLIPFALFAIPAYLSVPLILPVYLTKKFCRNVWNAAFVFALLTYSIVYFHGHYAPGFPWALPGYVWSGDLNIMQALSIWGIYGQTFFTLLVGCILGVGFYYFRNSLSEGSFRKCFFPIITAIVLIFSVEVYGFMRIPGDANSVLFENQNLGENSEGDAKKYKVRCVQGSILQKNKMDKNLASSNLNLYLNLSKMRSKYDNWNPDFVIWPEASVPYLFSDKSTVLSHKLAGVVPPNGYLLVGAVRKDSVRGDIYNSVVILDEFGKNIANYDKKHLVPFGEYIPFRRFIPKIFAPIANSIGDFAVGKKSNLIELKGLKIALTICYEAIFSGEFISNDDVNVIVNVTNDAWFGHTSELVQHLNIVRARAIEEGVPLIRITNFGISAVFDAYGRKVETLATDRIGVMDFYVPKRIEKTFFRKFFMD